MQYFSQWFVERKSYLVEAGFGFLIGCVLTVFVIAKSSVQHINFSMLLWCFLMTGWLPGIGLSDMTKVPVVHQNISRGRLLLWCCGASYSGMALGMILVICLAFVWL